MIVPGHYDDFFTPLGGDLSFSFNVNLAGFVDEIEAIDRHAHVATLPPVRPTG